MDPCAHKSNAVNSVKRMWRAYRFFQAVIVSFSGSCNANIVNRNKCTCLFSNGSKHLNMAEVDALSMSVVPPEDLSHEIANQMLKAT